MLKRLFVIVLSVIAFETVNAQYPNPTVRRLRNRKSQNVKPLPLLRITLYAQSCKKILTR